MNNTFTCPQCGKLLKTAKAMAVGTKIKCPQCATIFAATDENAGFAATAPAPSAAAPPASSRRLAPRQEPPPEEDWPREEEGRRPKRKKKAGSSTGLIVGLIAGGVGLLVVLVVTVVVIVVIINSSSPRQQIIGVWQPDNRRFESIEFTSDGRVLISANLNLGIQLSGTYHFLDNDTVDISIQNLGFMPRGNRQVFRVTVTRDVLTLVNTVDRSRESFRRIR